MIQQRLPEHLWSIFVFIQPPCKLLKKHQRTEPWHWRKKRLCKHKLRTTQPQKTFHTSYLTKANTLQGWKYYSKLTKTPAMWETLQSTEKMSQSFIFYLNEHKVKRETAKSSERGTQRSQQQRSQKHCWNWIMLRKKKTFRNFLKTKVKLESYPRFYSIKFSNEEPGMLAHSLNPNTWETEGGRYLRLRSAWSTQRLPRHTEKPWEGGAGLSVTKENLQTIVTFIKSLNRVFSASPTIHNPKAVGIAKYFCVTEVVKSEGFSEILLQFRLPFLFLKRLSYKSKAPVTRDGFSTEEACSSLAYTETLKE